MTASEKELSKLKRSLRATVDRLKAKGNNDRSAQDIVVAFVLSLFPDVDAHMVIADNDDVPFVGSVPSFYH